MGCNHSVEVAEAPSSMSKTTATRDSVSSSKQSMRIQESDSSEQKRETHGGDSRIMRPTLRKAPSAIEQVQEIRKEEGDLKTNVVHLEVPLGKPIEEVYDGVHNGPILGSGIAGEVRLVTHKATGHKYAVKCLDLGQVKTDEGLRQLREEIVIMCQLDHPNIVRLEEVYESHSEIFLVQELCVGGDLFDRLDAQPNYHYSEAQCARLVKQMLCAVRYLHSKGIVHRDLKLENFLFSSADPDSELKMIDFGLSKHFKFGQIHHEAVGTPYTVAPEIIRGSYDEKCDIWSIGVLSYLLLSGDSPFGGCGEPGQNMATVKHRILRGSVHFKPNDVWATVSPDAKDFIKLLLQKDPLTRPTAIEAQRHPWIQDCYNRNASEEDTKLRPEVVQALVAFKEFSDIHKLLCEVLSFTLLPEQIKGLRKEFEKMDTDDSGEISLCALKKVLTENAGAGSLGALTESEVEDVFNAMRVRKSEQRIQWHEFIAASITQCRVDEKNLRLAFDRLDNDHKGFITLDNVMDLVGKEKSQNEEALREMWSESMKSVNCQHARITYDDFLLLMKGQGCGSFAKSPVCPASPRTKRRLLSPTVPEDESITIPASISFTVLSDSKTEGIMLKSSPFEADSRRGLLLPEHEKDNEIADLINDDTKSPLVVNRTLYRAHRQMRLAVLEASKRFEEQQARRARETLMAESQTGTTEVSGAALVMRHHKNSNDVSPEAVQRFLTQEKQKDQSLIETASSRGGRRGRKKTISDMSCMLSFLKPETSLCTMKVSFTADESSASLGKSPSLRTFGTIESVFRPSPEVTTRQE